MPSQCSWCNSSRPDWRSREPGAHHAADCILYRSPFTGPDAELWSRRLRELLNQPAARTPKREEGLTIDNLCDIDLFLNGVTSSLLPSTRRRWEGQLKRVKAMNRERWNTAPNRRKLKFLRFELRLVALADIAHGPVTAFMDRVAPAETIPASAPTLPGEAHDLSGPALAPSSPAKNTISEDSPFSSSAKGPAFGGPT